MSMDILVHVRSRQRVESFTLYTDTHMKKNISLIIAATALVGLGASAFAADISTINTTTSTTPPAMHRGMPGNPMMDINGMKGRGIEGNGMGKMM